MPEKVLVFTAWPYANGPLHLGHVAGCYLPADIFARYHRAVGNQVVMLSGSDQHGTPVTVRAEQEGVSPADVAARYHKEFLETWDRLGISYDLFTRTTTDNHRETVQEIFQKLREQGDLYKDTTPSSSARRTSASCRTVTSSAHVLTAAPTTRAATSATSAAAR